MVPVLTEESPAAWAALDRDGKRERLLEAAAIVFTEEGFDAPMPRVAKVAGIGVGSLYRAFGSKDELIAALVVEQLGPVRDEVAAAGKDEDAGRALENAIRHLTEWQASNKLISAALAATSGRREVQLAVGELSLAWQELLDRARSQGAIRNDATVTDVRLIFAATRAADEVEEAGRRRMVDLLLDAMRPADPER